MTKKFVRVACDVHCKWEGLPPNYRVYVNNELFTERTWTWTGVYLKEFLQIEAEPGKYQIQYELVPPNLAELHVENIHVTYGPGKIKNNSILWIHE